MLEALTLSESRYRALVEHLPDTVITLFDDELRLLVVEGGAASGPRAPELTEGRRLRQGLAPDALAEVEPHFRAALAGEGRSFDFESPDTGVTWWFQVAPMLDDAGRVIGGVAVQRDVSARA